MISPHARFPRGETAIPELGEDLREQQGVGAVGVDPNRHRYERDPDEDTSEEEWQPDGADVAYRGHRGTAARAGSGSGGSSWRAMPRMFSGD